MLLLTHFFLGVHSLTMTAEDLEVKIWANSKLREELILIGITKVLWCG